MLKKIVILLSLILWPLNLYLSKDIPKLQTPQTIFSNDYQGEQLVLRNIHLYPSPLFARVFQNKPRIYLNKFIGNFFVLTDINNYFFGSQPEPIFGNHNLFKFPFFGVVYLFYGIFFIQKFKYKKFAFFFFGISVILLSMLQNFDGYDFILWIPVSLITIHGINSMHNSNRKLFNVFSLIFMVFALTEIIRSFIR